MAIDPVDERKYPAPLRGQLIFGLVFLGLSILLLSQIGSQTKWINKSLWSAQPRLWPMIGLVLMVGGTAIHLWKIPRRKFTIADRIEIRIWRSALEYAVWFMGYVFVVPVIGYLPATLIFMPVLVHRLGYRGRSYRLWSMIFGFGTVVLFKSLLSVKIPGGLIYEYLPGALRSFFILNF